jgi:hypothetical protein
MGEAVRMAPEVHQREMSPELHSVPLNLARSVRQAATDDWGDDAPDSWPADGAGALVHRLTLEMVGTKQRPERRPYGHFGCAARRNRSTRQDFLPSSVNS